MGELLRFYLGDDHRDTTRAFWLGASRLMNPRPVLSSGFAAHLAANLAVEEATAEDAWTIVGVELREAIELAEANGQEAR